MRLCIRQLSLGGHAHVEQPFRCRCWSQGDQYTEELLGKTFTAQRDQWIAVAITAKFLQDRPLYQQRIGEHELVIVTSDGGANRVYNAVDTKFVRKTEGAQLVDSEGRRWQIEEAALVLENNSSIQRARVPAQRAFWFGWHAQFPDTVLID